MLRIKHAIPLSGYRLQLTLTDGSIVERDVKESSVRSGLRVDSS